MFVGNFAAALIVKRVAPAVSLGSLVLGSSVPDILFSFFLLAGIEHVAIQPGITAVNALDLYDIPISHSLMMDAVWGALLGGLYFWQRRSRLGALTLFGTVLSHWFLDFVSHCPDMPLLPGVHSYFGLGLWQSVRATFIVEGLLWFVSVAIYASITSAKTRGGIFAFWSMIAALTAMWIVSLGGPPPPGVRAVGIVNAFLFSFVVAWAYWINSLRLTARQL
jgi:hypothetical protein